MKFSPLSIRPGEKVQSLDKLHFCFNLLILVMRFIGERFRRESREAAITELREKLFGPAKGLTGERWFARPLDGKEMRKWYFPSKYAMQDFRVDDYFDMQAERFKARPVHPSIKAFSDTVARVLKNKDKIKHLFESIDHETLLKSGPLQDLFSIYSIVNNESICNDMMTEEQGQSEVAFLLESLRELSGNNKALQVSRKINEEQLGWKEARRLVLDEMKQCERKDDLSVGMDVSDQFINDEDKEFLGRRHRFIDPLHRRKRLKWMERLLASKHSAQELKHHLYYKTQPDKRDVYPTNMGPATIKWPSPHQ